MAVWTVYKTKITENEGSWDRTEYIEYKDFDSENDAIDFLSKLKTQGHTVALMINDKRVDAAKYLAKKKEQVEE